MQCTECNSSEVTERPECTARGYRRFRCRVCGKQFNERSGGVLNYSAPIRMSGRVASFRNAPERAGHCLTRMLP